MIRENKSATWRKEGVAFECGRAELEPAVNQRFTDLHRLEYTKENVTKYDFLLSG